jgi:CRP/FNR family transcriptional regulator, anaerobic regulatory protein
MQFKNSKEAITCRACPLRLSGAFAHASRPEIAAIQAFKSGHLEFAAGRDMLPRAGNGHFYTLFSGWAFRYALVDGGDRQILNFLLPGDLIGFEGVFGVLPHYGVLSATVAELCAFPIAGFAKFAEANPRLGMEIARLSYSDGRLADHRMTALGRRPADARTAALFIELYDRLLDRKMINGDAIAVPVTHEQLADALGLTSVYVSRTLQLLDRQGLAHFERGTLVINDLRGLRALAGANGKDGRPSLAPLL